MVLFKKNMRFSLIIPCYNEAKNLPALIESLKVFESHEDIEIIFVNNGSQDNTPQVFHSRKNNNINMRMVQVQKNVGYGNGILRGLKEAKGEILGWTHADMQTDPKDALKGLMFFDHHKQKIFVKGNRFGRSFFDNIFTFGMSIFETIILKSKMNDINAQPTMFPRELLDSWASAPDDFSLDLFAYYQAKKQGYKIIRFPVRFDKRAFGQSKWNINWISKWNFICRTLKYSLKLRKNQKK